MELVEVRMLDLNPCVTPRALQSRRQHRRALQLHGASGSRNGVQGVQCQFSLHVVQRTLQRLFWVVL